MSELNEKQQQLCDALDGFVIVDAGPGTGKTHSIVQRYVNILSKDVNPMDILMLTFTRNAAEEMETRISSRITRLISQGRDPDGILANAVKNLRVSTIDSFCLEVVLNSPEVIRDFFDPKNPEMMLSRSAVLSENETLNRQYFSEFYARFIRDHAEEYIDGDQDITAVLGEHPMDIYKLINKLMSRGIIPKKKGWFGSGKDTLIGKRDVAEQNIRSNMKNVVSKVKDLIKDGDYTGPELPNGFKAIPDEMILEAVNDDRETLLRLIHDIYYGYMAQCIKDSRLTFGLCELFALIILTQSAPSRNMHSVEYLTIDEFQDTNELQMKICLLVLKKPNMCVVGDWKQGIFGFRFVSIDNIMQFGTRIGEFYNEMIDNRIEFPFEIEDPVKVETIKFDCNYRSSKTILDAGFQALDIKGNETEEIRHGEIVELTSMNNDVIGDWTEVNCIEAADKDDEIIKAVDMITQYRFGDGYKIVEKEDDDVTVRNVEYGDIAVLCRTSENCTKMYEECKRRHIPVYLQGDIEIMSTREGKLVLAWLRYLNDVTDVRGLTAILAEAKYPLCEIKKIVKSKGALVPNDIREQLCKMNDKKRRINDLITSIFDYYSINNGVAQTIINVLSSAHDDSLMTISDLIRLIEDDIEAGTTYNVEPLIDKKAVIIQTAHKSKGLEYPIVLIVGINSSTFPATEKGGEYLRFDDISGVRSTNCYIGSGDHSMVVRSWQSAVVKAGFQTDYSEERRLLFVAMTRAKQYLTLTACNPSRFFKHYQARCRNITPKPYDTKKLLGSEPSSRPVIGDYEKKRMSVSVHDLMSTIQITESEGKKEGKGKEYGEKVHERAYLYLRRHVDSPDIEEMEYIKEIIESRRDAKLSGEIKFVLPVDDVSIKGTIDLLVEYEDRIEIHDYKTDVNDDYEKQYRLQLSVYAQAVMSMGKKVECYLDYVSLKQTKRIEPQTLDDIKERIAEYKRSLKLPN